MSIIQFLCMYTIVCLCLLYPSMTKMKQTVEYRVSQECRTIQLTYSIVILWRYMHG